MTCVGNDLELTPKDMEAYCYNYGVKKFKPEHREQQLEARSYNGWFKWTALVFLIQSVLFYIPHWIWKNFERGWVDSMTQDLKISDVVTSDVATQKIKLAAECFRNGKHLNTLYAAVMTLCELLNWTNVTLQLYILNYLFDNYFMDNPFNVIWVITEQPDDRLDPLEMTFPKSIACTLNTFGPSGSIDNKENFCTVPVNYFNEFCFILMWYWFIAVFVCTALSFLTNRLVLTVPIILKMSLRTSYKGVGATVWNKICSKFGACDLLVLKTMLAEMNQKRAEELVNELALQIKVNRSTITTE